MQRIYFDNASTSFPKAPGVTKAMMHFMQEVGSNINRGGYAGAYSAENTVIETRMALSRLFNAKAPKNIIFTANVTQSLNMLAKGLLKKGDHVLVSTMEHNALMRPLAQLVKEREISFTRIPCDAEGSLLVNSMEELIRPNTRAVFMLHASNVCGTVMPAAEVGRIAKKHNLYFVLDAAQTAGVLPVDMQQMHVDAVAFTGHKGLLGPQGIGGFAVTDTLAKALSPLLSGGTGSLSDSEEVPAFLPDKFEPGTMNLPGIYGLHAALQYIEKTGPETILKQELELAKHLHNGLLKLEGVRVLGSENWQNRTAVVSADFTGADNAEISYILSEKYGIDTRCGLHCSPGAHKTLGTFPQGTVRFSLSSFNTRQEVEACLAAVQEILQRL